MRRFPAPTTAGRIGLALAATTMMFSGLLLAQSESPKREISYRLIFAPVDQILQLTSEEMRAVKREQFDAWVGMQQQDAPESISGGVSIRRAEYQATFDGQQLVNGTASLSIASTHDEPARLMLEPMNLAIASPTWSAQPNEAAKLGVQSDGRQTVIVPSTGMLRFDWTLAPHSRATGEVSFQLKLPPCPINRLRFTLPDSFSLKSSVGVASRLTASATSGHSEWQVDAGGHAEITLRMRSDDAQEPVVFLRQSNTYTISEQGIELATELNLNSEEAPIEELQLSLAPGLQLTRARSGKDPISWSVASAGIDEPTTILLTLDPPLQGLNHVLSLSCVSTNEDQTGLRQLPRVQVASVQWQQELARVRIKRPLVLEELQLEQAAQFLPAQGDADVDGDGDMVNVWLLQPTAKIMVQAALAPEQIQFDQGTSVTVNANEAVAEVALRVRSVASEIFELQTAVKAGWIIDAVETDRADSIHDWQFQPDPSSKQERLLINFRDPITASTDSIIRIRARRRFDATERPFTAAEFQPIELSSQGGQRRFLTIRLGDGLSVDYGRDRRVTWLTLDDLDAIEATLVEADEDSAIVLLNESHRDLTIEFKTLPEAQRPFHADVEITSEITPRSVDEQIQISIDRTNASLSSLRVQIALERDEPIRWFPAKDPQRTLPSQRTTNENGETWSIEWPEPSDETIIIIGARTFQLGDKANVRLPLVRIDGAATQQGVVRIEAPGELSLSYDHTSLLSPTPVQRQDFRRLSRQRRAYRYNPAANIFAENGPLVSIGVSGGETSRATVQQATLRTHIDQTGTSRNQYSIGLENQSAAELSIALPESALMRHVYVDGRKIAFQTVTDKQVIVPLPADRRFVTVQLEYDEPGQPLGIWRQIRCVRPQLDVPVLAESWQLWTPPEYAVRQPTRSTESPFHTCLRRLFGPLLRASNEAPFNAFARQDWAGLFDSAIPPADLSPAAIQWLQQIGDPTVLTWEDAAQANSDIDRWIDATRLTARNITPSQAVPLIDAATPFERGVGRLQSAHLVLVQLEEGVILTTGEFASQFSDDLRRTDCPVIVNSDIPLPHSEATSQVTPWIDLRRPQTWVESPQFWSGITKSEHPFVAGGWRLQQIASSTGSSQTVYRRDAFLIAGCLAFLVALAGVWWIRNLDINVAIAAVITGVVLACLLPVPFHWIGLGACWGAIVGFSLTPAVPEQSQSKTNSRAAASRRATLTTTGLILIAACLYSVSAQGQEEPPVGNREDPTYRVFVPTNSDGSPAGDYVLIPKEFHRKLQLKTASRGEAAQWLLQTATYRANWTGQTGVAQPQIDSVLAEYSFVIPAAVAAIELRLPAESATLLEREARLNGRPIRLEWNSEKSAVTLPIRDAGVHQLAMTFRIPNQPQATSIDLPIPRAMNSVLFLKTPEEPVKFVAESAYGATHRDDATGDLRVDLGPTDRLQFRWGSEPLAARPAVEQLSWLQIKPEQVAWNTRLMVDGRRWNSNILRIEVDARLRLDPVESDQPITYQASTTNGVRILDYPINAEDDEPQLIRLNLLAAGWSGLGRLQLPRLRILGGERVPHELGVTFDSRLEGRPNVSNGTDRLQTGPFATRWGGETVPDYAFRLNEELPEWSCTTKLVKPIPQAEIQVAYELAQESTDVIFVANLSTAGALRFQQQIQIAEDFEVKSVMQIDGNTVRKLRWSRNKPREVTAFLDQTASSPYQLAIVGRQTNQGLGARELPRIKLLECLTSGEEILIFRRSDVLLATPDGEVAEEPSSIDSFINAELGLSRWHASFSVASGDAIPTIEVRENQQRLRAELVNIVTRQDGVWQQDVRVSCQVDEGFLDAVRFEIPQAWTGGFDNPDLGFKVELEKSPRPGMARVTIWPTVSFDEMRLAGPIPTTPGQPLQIPNIRLLEDGEIKRRLYLPTRVDEQAVQWSTVNLAIRELDPNVAPQIVNADEYQFFEVTSDEFQATRLPARTAASAPKVHLADIRLSITGSDQYRGQAIFDLQPGGMANCSIRCPQSIKIVSATVEDVFVDLPQDVNQSGVLVELMSIELPQRITVIFSGKIEPGTTRRQQVVHAPVIERSAAGEDATPIEVLQTLWTLQATPPGEVELLTSDADERHLADVQLLRLNHLAEMIDLASQVATDFTPDELTQWYGAWGERYRASVRRIRPSRLTGNDPRAAKLSEIQQRQLDAVEKLEATELSEQLSNRVDIADSIDVWNAANPYRERERFHSVQGGSPSITFNHLPHADHSPLTRVAIALMVGLAGFGAIARIHRTRLEDVRWMYLFGVIGGLGWWLWLQPSIIGWVIVAACLGSMRLLRWPSIRI